MIYRSSQKVYRFVVTIITDHHWIHSDRLRDETVLSPAGDSAKVM
jgi:hypothetical protein